MIGLYASTNPECAAPYFSRRWCVNRYPEAMSQFNRRDATTARWGTRVRDPSAMDLIQVEDVIAQFTGLMQAHTRRAALVDPFT